MSHPPCSATASDTPSDVQHCPFQDKLCNTRGASPHASDGETQGWKRSLVAFPLFINMPVHKNGCVLNPKGGIKKTGLCNRMWSLARIISSTAHSHFQQATQSVSLPSTKHHTKTHHGLEAEPAFQTLLNWDRWHISIGSFSKPICIYKRQGPTGRQAGFQNHFYRLRYLSAHIQPTAVWQTV